MLEPSDLFGGNGVREQAMRDITERLRCWTHAVDAVPASDLMDEAADEIDRLRLTDAERQAVEYFAALTVSPRQDDSSQAAVLRGLLERLGGER